MNPPFVPWERMGVEDQDIVQQVLGTLATYRADIAMAFIWRAAQSLRENAVLASVLPTPLFETHSGREWREKLASTCDLLLLGRFEGYGFFRSSIVEPGMLVLKGKPEPRQGTPSAIRVIMAKSGCEDLALRALRQKRQLSAEPTHWDVFEIQRSSISPASWMPRFRHVMQRVEALASAGVPAVADLFDVRQGALTGNNGVFVLSATELAQLPKKERTFFRPIASNSTIHDGALEAKEFVFYPYGRDGLLLPTETELRARVRDYFTRYLEPNRKALAGRADVRNREWWDLSRPRLAWQRLPRRKIVSTYFGDRGSFAYDRTGEFVVLQGYGWSWRKRPGQGRRRFEESLLPWAYLALLNSRVFEDLLESFCPRVQGGQYNLSRRFVDRVYLPDLSDDLRVTGTLVEELATMGRRIDAGQMPELESLDTLAARAFGTPLPA